MLPSIATGTPPMVSAEGTLDRAGSARTPGSADACAKASFICLWILASFSSKLSWEDLAAAKMAAAASMAAAPGSSSELFTSGEGEVGDSGIVGGRAEEGVGPRPDGGLEAAAADAVGVPRGWDTPPGETGLSGVAAPSMEGRLLPPLEASALPLLLACGDALAACRGDRGGRPPTGGGLGEAEDEEACPVWDVGGSFDLGSVAPGLLLGGTSSARTDLKAPEGAGSGAAEAELTAAWASALPAEPPPGPRTPTENVPAPAADGPPTAPLPTEKLVAPPEAGPAEPPPPTEKLPTPKEAPPAPTEKVPAPAEAGQPFAPPPTEKLAAPPPVPTEKLPAPTPPPTEKLPAPAEPHGPPPPTEKLVAPTEKEAPPTPLISRAGIAELLEASWLARSKPSKAGSEGIPGAADARCCSGLDETRKPGCCSALTPPPVLETWKPPNDPAAEVAEGAAPPAVEAMGIKAAAAAPEVSP